MNELHPLIKAFLNRINTVTEFAFFDRTPTPNELAKLVSSLIVREEVARLPAVDHNELNVALGNYVKARFSYLPKTSVMIEQSEVLVISVMAKPVAPEQQGLDGNMVHQTRDMFRPFLVRAIYAHLVGKAAQGLTTTYEAIANEFGLPNKGNQLGSTLSPLLSDIFRFCAAGQQPMLTSIVVRKSGELKGLPGEGFWTLYSELWGSLPIGGNGIAHRRKHTESFQASVFEYWATLGA